ncbi:MAG TPA: hypothetical protein ENJ82_05850, partial [Bacteroidetes bacterium]|nr:hypothetical protein [Bacteroidota bacterium]
MRPIKIQPIQGFLIGFAVLLLTFASLSAQQYCFTNYNISDGLSQTQVMAVCQDRRGYLWIGTYGGGVNRFDGHEFVSFTSEDGLLGNTVNDVLEDGKGNLWFSHLAEGICRYDGVRFECFSEKDGLFMNDRAQLLEDSRGNIWVMTNGNGLYQYDGERFHHFSERDGVTSDTIHAGGVAPNGDLWFATGKGLCHYDYKVFRTLINFNANQNHAVSALTFDKNGWLWLAHEDGISSFDGQNFYQVKNSKEQVKNIIKVLYADSRSRIWIVTEQGLKCFDSGIIKEFKDQNGLWNSIINCAFEDQSGNIWIGTNGDGISQFNNESFVHFTNSPSSKLIFAIDRQSKDEYWVGAGSNLLSFDGKDFTTVPGSKKFIQGYVMDIMKARSGDTWISTFAGLFRYKGKSFKAVPLRKNKSMPIVLNTFEDKAGDIWISTKTGFFVYRGDSIIDLARQNEIFNTYGTQVTEDQSGGKWLVTATQGVIYYKNGEVKTYTESDGLQSNRVRNVTIDENGSVWFGTYNGLCRFDGRQFCYVQDPNLTSKVILLLQLDNQGNLWAGTAQGIVQLQLNANSDPLKVNHYGISEGFLGLECNLNAVYKDSDGKLWFGNQIGLTCYDPDEDRPNTEIPKVHITGMKIFLEDVDWASRNVDSIMPWTNLPQALNLPYNQNHLRFTFTGVATTLPQRIRYRYMLEGLDQDWLPETDENHATYSSLPPGNYTFKVIARNSEGLLTPQAATYSFSITPPFWQRGWFYGIAGILVFGGIFLIFNTR